MRKKFITLFLVIVGSSICIVGCGNPKAEKQEIVKEEALESEEEEQEEEKGQEEKEQKEEVEQEEKEQKIEYELGITNLENTEYVPRPLEKIGEEGNPLETSEDYLGYYSNGYIGYNIMSIPMQ